MCTGEILPYIRPDGYNASLGQDPVEFRCVVLSDILSAEWVINGEPLDTIGEERGITEHFHVGDMSHVVTVEARAENDNITLECFRNIAPAYSGEIMLHIYSR